MSGVVMYGCLPSEKVAEENLVCRQIARTISEFGVNDRQRLFLMYLLSLEIEDSQKSQLVASVLKEVSPEVFVSGAVDGGQDGTSGT